MIRKFFTCANTCKGFVNYFDSNLAGLDKIYILKGGPGTGKSTLMKKVGACFAERGTDIEHIYCSSDYKSLDGVVIPSRKTAIVDGTSPHVIEPAAPGALEDYVNLGEAWDSAALAPCRSEILSLKQDISQRYAAVYGILARAKGIHDDWERIYIENLDNKKADEMAQALLHKVLGNCTSDREAVRRERFLGSATYDGPVNFIENLTQNITRRYFIKGRPGTGKSTILKRLANEAQRRGFDAEVYHCSLDPDSLDMVILRELDVCVFDSTAPHEVFPSRIEDEIVDVYAGAVRPGTDETHAKELAAVEQAYRNCTAEATQQLAMIKEIHDALEALYIANVDFTVIDGITSRLIREIESR